MKKKLFGFTSVCSFINFMKKEFNLCFFFVPTTMKMLHDARRKLKSMQPMIRNLLAHPPDDFGLEFQFGSSFLVTLSVSLFFFLFCGEHFFFWISTNRSHGISLTISDHPRFCVLNQPVDSLHSFAHCQTEIRPTIVYIEMQKYSNNRQTWQKLFVRRLMNTSGF